MAERVLTAEEVAELGLPAYTPPPAQDPGFLRTLLSTYLQGFTKRGSDEAVGAITRVAVSPGGGAAWRQPGGGTVPLETGWDVYRAGRGSEREVLRGAAENRPKAAFTAEVLGDLTSDYLLSRAGLPGVGGLGYNVGTGMLSGLLGGEAELTPDRYTPREGLVAGIETAAGGAGGAIGTGIGAGVAKVSPALLRRAAAALERRGVSLGRRTLMSGSGQLANKEEVSDEAVREALASGAIVPGGTTQGAARRLERLAEDRGAAYGATIEQLEKLGVKGPDADTLARKLIEEGDEALAVSGANEAVPRAFWDAGEALLRKTKEPEAVDALVRARLARQGVSLPPAPPPPQALPLTQAEGLKRTLQKEARYGRIEDTPVNEAKKKIAATLREGIEERVDEAALGAPPGSELDALASSFQPIKARLTRTLEAEEAAGKGATAAAKRATFGLTDYLWALGAGGAGGLAGGGETGALGAGAALLGHRVLRNRGPSTGASLAYWLSRGANAGARAGANNPEALMRGGRSVGGAASRAAASPMTEAEVLAEWLLRSGKDTK